VIRPVHLRWWFISGSILLVALGIYAVMRYRIAQLRRVIRVRDRIAMDLHDDVGSNLSGIVLFSSAVAGHRDKLPVEAASMLDRITQSSSRAIEDMNDIVWSVNTLHDQLADVLDRMQVYAQPFCDAADIQLHFDVPESLRARKIDMEQRRAIYLVFKESITNAIKHAACSHIHVRLRITGGSLELEVEDDGRGMDQMAATTCSLGGHGLGNMHRRATAAGGSITFTSAIRTGTRILLRVPLGR
jgi:signal transduction histidine kinase